MVAAAKAEYGDDLILIGMAGRGDRDEYDEFIDRYGLAGIPQVPDSDNHELWLSFGVRGQPAWALVRADGSTEVVFGGFPSDLVEEAAGA